MFRAGGSTEGGGASLREGGTSITRIWEVPLRGFARIVYPMQGYDSDKALALLLLNQASFRRILNGLEFGGNWLSCMIWTRK